MPAYKITPKAHEDLAGIWRYTLDQWGERQADTYLDDLDAAFVMLATMPEMCRERPELGAAVRLYPHAHHLIVYQIRDPETILIVRVLHESMDVTERLAS